MSVADIFEHVDDDAVSNPFPEAVGRARGLFRPEEGLRGPTHDSHVRTRRRESVTPEPRREAGPDRVRRPTDRAVDGRQETADRFLNVLGEHRDMSTNATATVRDREPPAGGSAPGAVRRETVTAGTAPGEGPGGRSVRERAGVHESSSGGSDAQTPCPECPES